MNITRISPVTRDNTGIVPPWMAQGGNTGIVPPWMGKRPIPLVPNPDLPRILTVTPRPIVANPDVPRIMGSDTGFDPRPIVANPDVPRIL